MGRWCGESNDFRKYLGVLMNSKVFINIWCNIVIKGFFKKFYDVLGVYKEVKYCVFGR